MRILPIAAVLLALPFASPGQPRTPPAAAAAAEVAPGVLDFLEQFDATGEGRVSWEQFVRFRQQRFAQTDRNGDGSVDEQEYVDEYLQRLEEHLQAARQGHIRQTRTRFDALDGDKDGYVTRAEFDAAGQRTWEGYQRLQAKPDSGRPQQARGPRDPLRMPTTHSLSGMRELYDRNGDGEVARSEFDQVRDGMFATADRHHAGRLSFDDYLAEFEGRLEQQASRVREAAQRQARVRFKALDTDHNGRLDFTEYQVSGKRLFERADSNGDGVVDARDPEPAQAGHGSGMR